MTGRQTMNDFNATGVSETQQSSTPEPGDAATATSGPANFQTGVRTGTHEAGVGAGTHGSGAQAQPTLSSSSSRMREDAIQHLIGQNLKSIYGAILQEPIPDDLLRRLDELERKEKQQ